MEYLNSNARKQTRLRLRRILPGFETAQQARERSDNLIDDLKMGDQATRLVGHKLRSCCKREPCKSPMCHSCVRGLRKSVVPAAINCIDQAQTANGILKRQIVAFSAVLAEERYAAGDLHNADLRKINERIQRRHQRAELPLVFAGVDISYNEDSEERWPSHWQLQVYGVCVGLDLIEIRARLAKQYLGNKTTPRPLRVRRCRNLPKALSYMIKPYFGRRVSYIDDTGRFNTRKVSLKRPQAQELATWIAQYPLTARYALTGCRRYGDRIEPASRNNVLELREDYETHSPTTTCESRKRLTL